MLLAEVFAAVVCNSFCLKIKHIILIICIITKKGEGFLACKTRLEHCASRTTGPSIKYYCN